MKDRKHNVTVVLAAVIAAALAVAALISFIDSVPANDIQVFLAAAGQVKYQESSGLRAVLEAWELKGAGNRILMYILYRVAGSLNTGVGTELFSIAAKAAYAFIAAAFILVSSLLFTKDGKKRVLIFGIEFIAVFATYTVSHLQAEMTCVVILMLIFSCLVHGGRAANIAAGILGATLFFFKSVFIVMFLVVLVGTYLYKDGTMRKKDLLQCLVSFLPAELIMVLFVRFYYPQEFADMANASEFQNTLLSRGSAASVEIFTTEFIDGLRNSVVAIPILLAGIAALIVMIVFYIRERNAAGIMMLLLMWVLTADIILVSQQFFIYHYFLLVFPSLVSILMLWKRIRIPAGIFVLSAVLAILVSAACLYLKEGYLQVSIINYSTVMLLSLHILAAVLFAAVIRNRKFTNGVILFLLAVVIFFWMNYSSVAAPKYRNEKALQKASEENYQEVFPEDFGDEPVLFLDKGTVLFHVEAPSYSRYFYNLPLQRLTKKGVKWDVKESELKKAMEYSGKYIVMSKWMDISEYPELEKKIGREYERLEGGGIYVVTPDSNMFKLKNPPGIDSMKKNTNNYIMVRKAE